MGLKEGGTLSSHQGGRGGCQAFGLGIYQAGTRATETWRGTQVKGRAQEKAGREGSKTRLPVLNLDAASGLSRWFKGRAFLL